MVKSPYRVPHYADRNLAPGHSCNERQLWVWAPFFLFRWPLCPVLSLDPWWSVTMIHKPQTFRHITGDTNLAVVKGGLSSLRLLRESALILTVALVKPGQVMLNN